ncbi:hypothetical protein J2Z43_000206 [Clostridioides mangenotii]|uniref:Uncharacterized protein n=1 Tax=Metaclostridioides mangenotii TaxID=1540 RepID=A0ABS4E790_9FIRM|nr:hypothetical protein [Clostridioides mangenotii]
MNSALEMKIKPNDGISFGFIEIEYGTKLNYISLQKYNYINLHVLIRQLIY